MKVYNILGKEQKVEYLKHFPMKILQGDFKIYEGGLIFCTAIILRNKSKNIAFEGHFQVCDYYYNTFINDIKTLDNTLTKKFKCGIDEMEKVIIFGKMHEYGLHNNIKKFIETYGKINYTHIVKSHLDNFLIDSNQGLLSEDNELLYKF